VTLMECVPNFSEGKDAAKIQAVVEAASRIPGVAVLDVESNADHNRSVLTLAGPPSALIEAALAATEVAVRLIDLNQHKGEHPRMGAMDVVPFVPLGETSLEEAVQAAYRFGELAWERLHVPVYYYGKAARLPPRADLAEVRRGGFEGLRKEAPVREDRRPDVGGPELHPTAGAIAVGARPVLIAYNVYLTTPDVSVAKRIARAIRGRDGGLAEVKALGFDIRERQRAQVSMNMTDYRRTPLHRAFELIRTEARRYGVATEESEIVGLVPEDALLDAAEHYLQLNRFDRSSLLERRLAERLSPKFEAGAGKGASSGPGSWAERPLAQFLEDLAARKATPGGGSASACAGALGAALGEMVLAYAARDGELPEQLRRARDELRALRFLLLRNVDEDARAYEAVRASRHTFPGRDGSPPYWSALRRAAEVPRDTARAAVRALQILREEKDSVKPAFQSDFVAATSLLEAARRGAIENIRANLGPLKEGAQDISDLEASLRDLEANPE